MKWGCWYHHGYCHAARRYDNTFHERQAQNVKCAACYKSRIYRRFCRLARWKRYKPTFSRMQVLVEHQDEFGVGHGTCHHLTRLYTLPNPIDDTNASTKLVATEECTSSLRYHQLANLNKHDLQKVQVYFNWVPRIKGIKKVCRPCLHFNAHKLPF